MIDFIPICNLCDKCVWSDECVLTATFPVIECAEFDDGYEGPEYPDDSTATAWQWEVRHYQAHGY